MNWLEEFLLNWSGKIIIGTGFCGCAITIMFDKMARGVGIWSNWGWLQLSGLAVFFTIFILGILVDTMLDKARKMLEDYLRG
jgi:hypothetical protein